MPGGEKNVWWKWKISKKTLGGFIFVNLFPSLQYSIFPLPPGPFESFLILGKQWTILRTKREKHVLLEKKSRQSKIWGALFSEISREVLQTFLLHITGQQLIRTEFVPTHVPELTHLQFINIFWNWRFFDVFINQQVVTVQTALPIPHFLQCYMQIVFKKTSCFWPWGCGKKSDLKPCWSRAGLRRFHCDYHNHHCHNKHYHTITTTTTITRLSQPQWKHPCTSSLGQVRTWDFLVKNVGCIS